MKDLRIFLDRNVNEMLIVDDRVCSFAFQLENGIPVKPFEGKDVSDDELLYLVKYLKTLCKEEQDLRKANGEKLWGIKRL